MAGKERLYLWCFLAFYWLATIANAAKPTALNQQEYLLVDPRVVEEIEGVTLRLGQVKKHPANPLMRENKPWEVRYDNVYANVLYDEADKPFKCFYSPFIIDEVTTGTPQSQRANTNYRWTPTREMGLCYAFSEDGIVWTKPELGVVELHGSKKNNLVLRGIHGAGVIRESSDADPAKRYKLFAGREVPGKDRFTVVAFSSDGIHWTDPIPCTETTVQGDTHNNPLWVQQRNTYVGFTREYKDQRVVMRTESTTFLHWSKATEVLRGDLKNQTYAMQVFASHGIYLGMLAILYTETDRVHGELAVSEDTVHWRRVCAGVPLVPNSDQRADYDYGCVYIAKSPFLVGDDIWIYYGASDAPHSGWRNGFLALATLRPGRWAGYEHTSGEPPGRSHGRVTTAPIVCRGSQLRVNVLAPLGSLRVGVVGESELASEDCQPIRGDAVNAKVTWNSGMDLSGLVGRPVQLELEIDRGTVYAFEFDD